MKSSSCLFSAVLLSVASLISGDIYPTSPTGESVWKVGNSVKITWIDRGSHPTMKEMVPFTVDLYTGMNESQVKLANIGTNLPVNTTSIEYTVPDVKPYGKLYFLRFTVPNPKRPEDPYLFWTTRFTITDTNSTTPSVSTAATGALVSPTANLSNSDKTHSTSASHTSIISSDTEHQKTVTKTSDISILSSRSTSTTISSKPAESSNSHSSSASSSDVSSITSSESSSHPTSTSTHEPSSKISSSESTVSSSSYSTSLTSSSESSTSNVVSSTASTSAKATDEVKHNNANMAGPFALVWAFLFTAIPIFFM